MHPPPLKAPDESLHVVKGVLRECRGAVPQFIFFEVIRGQFINSADSVFAIIGNTVESFFEFSASALFGRFCQGLRGCFGRFLNVPTCEDEIPV